MASAVDICNLALSLLGERAEVAAISPPDGSVESQHCGRFYPMARDELLEMHAWTFAARRIVLAQAPATRPGWAYAYAMPANCLKPRSVQSIEAADDAESDDYLVETGDAGSRVIYTNRAEATLLYTASVTDTTRYTPLFVGALGRLLAVKLSGVVIKGAAGMQVAQAQERLFLVERAEAISSDSNVGSNRNAYRDRVPDLIKARGLRVTPYGRPQGGFR